MTLWLQGKQSTTVLLLFTFDICRLIFLRVQDKLQCPSFLILLKVHELNFPSFRLWTASAPRRTRQWSSRSPSTWWTACWAARPTRRSSRWRRRTPPRRDMLDMDRDMLDGLKTTRCWRWTPRVASEMWLLNFSRTVFLNLWSSWWGNVFMYFYILDLLAQCSKAKTSGCS